MATIFVRKLIFAHRIVSSALVVTLLVFGGSSMALAQNGGAKSKALQVVTLGDQPAAEVDYAAVWVAEELGYFADEGIKIDRRTYSNGPNMLLDWPSGKLDFGMAALTPFMQFAAGGGKFKIVLSLTKYNAPLVGLKKYHSYADLNGKKVGDPGLGTIHDAVLSYVEQTQGLHFQRVFGKVTDIAVMIQKGEVQAFIGWEPASALAIAQDPNLHYIVQIPPIKNLESLELAVAPKFAKENPDLAARFVRATLRGIEYIKNNPKEKVAELIAKKMNDSKDVPAVINALGSVDLTKPRVDMPSAGIILKTIAKQGKISPQLVKNTDEWLRKYIDYTYLDKAEKSLKK